ncbi:MAG: hypothetical protein P9L92_10310 [Candidatus Electryonea clarkiae]|nr:hypothetical protein [Candidatus Electryonea clarkiae]MDP8286932.1 hypothetical protein [Candidatus Electryonea clarkiae]
MKQLLIIMAALTILSVSSFAQECGPGCPACSGSGVNSSALLAPGTISLSYLSIPGGEEEMGILNLRSGLTTWMNGGIGYAFQAEKIVWNLRLQAIAEEESGLRPAVIIGTGSVQTGESDQSLYLQAAKNIEINEILTLSLSAGISSLIPDFDEVYGLAGATMTLYESWSPFINFDGKSIHPGISWNHIEWLTITGMMIEGETPAVLAGIQYRI